MAKENSGKSEVSELESASLQSLISILKDKTSDPAKVKEAQSIIVKRYKELKGEDEPKGIFLHMLQSYLSEEKATKSVDVDHARIKELFAKE